MSVEEKVRNIFLETLDIAESDLTAEAQLRSDLGATSVDVVEIVAALENEFDVDISDEEAASIRTFGDVVEYIESKQS